MVRSLAAQDGSPDSGATAVVVQGRGPVLPAGVVTALVMAAASLTPSLLPRTATFQGLVSGLSAAVGYGVAVLVAALVRRWVPRHSGACLRKVLGGLLVFGAGALFGYWLWRWAGWQEEVHGLAGKPSPGRWSPLVALAVMVVVFAAVLGLARLVRAGGRVVGRPLRRVVPTSLATIVGSIAFLLLLGAAADRFVVETALAAVDSSFDSANNGTPAGLVAPQQFQRSGSTSSLSPWDELGVQGRGFVARGAAAEELSKVTGESALEPIRVYAGLDTSEDLAELAAVVVEELERTDAFDRAVLCVAVPTGKGWVNPEVAQALEYLYAGDTAIASMQYSYLPSPLSFLVDPERAKDAGRELFNAIYERWAELPTDARPKLVVMGESLGSTGAQAAFSGLEDLRVRTDGALFIGPPVSNTLWRDLVQRRDPGTSQVLPVYDAGSTARFAATPTDLARPSAPWNGARVVFLQHASDPIVWWSSDLAWKRPAWLREERGKDVSPSTRWYPLVTFMQVTADTAVSNDVPAGHGHRYDHFVEYWAAIIPPDGWTGSDLDRLTAAANEHHEEAQLEPSHQPNGRR